MYRAYNICSNYQTLHAEFEFLRNYFQSNGFLISFIESKINKFLSQALLSRSTTISSNIQSRIVYFSIPFFGGQSECLKSELLTLLGKYFSDIKFHIILVNKFNIKSLFPFKDRLPIHMRSSLVYNYSWKKYLELGVTIFGRITVANLYF